MRPSMKMMPLALLVILQGWMLLAPVAARAEATSVTGADQVQTLDCAGGVANVTGSNNRIVFRGACEALNVMGDSNQVEVELTAGEVVNVVGNANRVSYRLVGGSEPPHTNLMGNDNTVEAAVSPAATADKALILGEDAITKTVDCTGKDVVIRGSSATLILRGGCHSLTITGDSTQVQAELAPGAVVKISGDSVSLAYATAGDGPKASVTITGAASKVQEIGAL